MPRTRAENTNLLPGGMILRCALGLTALAVLLVLDHIVLQSRIAEIDAPNLTALKESMLVISAVELLSFAVIAWLVFAPMNQRLRLAAVRLAQSNQALSENAERLKSALSSLQSHHQEDARRRRALQNIMDDLARERARLEREANERRQAEVWFRRLVEASPNGLLLIGPEGTIQLVNRQAERIFGYTKEELLGEPIEMLIPERLRSTHVRDRTAYLEQPEARATGHGRDLFGLRKDGAEIPVEIGLNPIQTSEGVSVLSTIIDITERKQAEVRLASYAEQLKSSNHELEKFAFVVSHDLKAPLRGIASVAKWLGEDFAGKVDDEGRENIELMLERTKRLGRLIDGILHYSRVARQEITLVPLDVHRIVVEVIDSIDPPDNVTIRIDGQLPSVEYDEIQLRQVFQNLISNAVEHLGRPAGEIVVSGTLEDGACQFSVRDNGVGIAERHLERIFQLFQTLKPKDESKSTGVGLSIVKRIVERNGGRVSVSSSEGEGTEFVFTVPLTMHTWTEAVYGATLS